MAEEVFDSKNITNDGVAIGTTTTQVLAARSSRAYAAITNDSDTVIYLALGEDAVLNKGIRLNASGGVYEINTDNLFKGVINAIHGGSGNKNLCVVEGE